MTALPSTEVEVINALSLLAHKVAPNVFDLSSLQWHVSIRDQIVRAQLLMADLKAADPAIRSVLIVGMGVAGISAAMTACELGIPQVYVVDQAGAPFELFRGVTSRFVGPFMYEWPSSFHADQGYPAHKSTPWKMQGCSPLTWSAQDPITADDLAKELTNCLTNWLSSRRTGGLATPCMLVSVAPDQVKQFAKDFAVSEGLRADESLGGGLATTPKAQLNALGSESAQVWGHATCSASPAGLKPDYLILAAGMGKETLAIPGSSEASPSFWANDTLKDPGTANQRVVVIGGGDGALQDALRALTIYDHPLSFVQALQKNSSFQRALASELPALLDADRQMRQHSAWGVGAEGQAMVDSVCRMAAEKLARILAVRRCVLACIRPGQGTVWLWAAGAHFDKAYLLNRFAIHLLWACYQKISRRPAGRMGFEVRFNTKLTHSNPPQNLAAGEPSSVKPTRWKLHVCSEDDEAVVEADKVVVRFGVQRDTIPGLQMLQLGVPNERDLKHRATLKGVELPFVALRDL